MQTAPDQTQMDELELIMLADDSYSKLEYAQSYSDDETLNGPLGEKIVWAFISASILGLAAVAGGFAGFSVAAIVVGIVWFLSREATS